MSVLVNKSTITQLGTLVCPLQNLPVHGASVAEHDERAHELMKTLGNLGLINDQKCDLWLTSLAYLGLVVSERGISGNPKKVQSIREAQTRDVNWFRVRIYFEISDLSKVLRIRNES